MRNDFPTTEPVALEAAPRNARNAKRKAIAPLAVEVDTSETPLRAKRDGCGCPPWLTACVHFGELTLWLGTLCPQCPDSLPKYAVALGTLVDCWCDEDHANLEVVTGEAFRTDDLPSAQAEFDRRAEELRTG